MAAAVNASVNVSTLFRELDFLDRFAAAADHGFTEVEFWWPGPDRLDAVVDAVRRAGVTVALFTIDAGDAERGDRGLLADPDPRRRRRLEASTELALDLAARLSCRRLYTLIGNRRADCSRDRQLAAAGDALAWVAHAARAHDVDVLVEPVNAIDNGPQIIDRAADASALIADLDLENLALLFDAYHVRCTEGDVVATLAAVHPWVGHVHLGDFPGRVEPGSGRIDFRALLAALDSYGYEGTLGLEYLPSTPTTQATFAALARAGLPLPAGVTP